MKKNRLLLVLLLFFGALFLFSAVNLYVAISEYRKADVLYTDVQEQYVSTVTPPQDLLSDAITPVVDIGISIDFDALTSKNADVIGWLYCADTPINYPVVQSEDNKYYLHKDLDGNYLRSGTLFSDYRNRSIGEDRQLVIYGHSMKNKTMFGSLLEYKKQAYFDAHPIMYFLTPDAEYRIELFAGCVMKVSDILYHPNPSATEFDVYIQSVIERSTFLSDVEVQSDDTIVVLSTCSYEFDNARYVAFGKLVPIAN